MRGAGDHNLLGSKGIIIIEAIVKRLQGLTIGSAGMDMVKTYLRLQLGEEVRMTRRRVNSWI